MTRDITPAGSPATGTVDEAFAEVRASFDRFCLAAGIEALGTMMEADVTAANFRAIVDGLLAEGYSVADVGKVMGGNFFRMWEQVAGAN
ncbi:microsomal dipeptidase-like Zn-dependent dipeptidase [Bradyrhizobium sp. LB7.2]